jgi:hypothetical protein
MEGMFRRENFPEAGVLVSYASSVIPRDLKMATQ